MKQHSWIVAAFDPKQMWSFIWIDEKRYCAQMVRPICARMDDILVPIRQELADLRATGAVVQRYVVQWLNLC